LHIIFNPYSVPSESDATQYATMFHVIKIEQWEFQISEWKFQW